MDPGLGTRFGSLFFFLSFFLFNCSDHYWCWGAWWEHWPGGSGCWPAGRCVPRWEPGPTGPAGWLPPPQPPCHRVPRPERPGRWGCQALTDLQEGRATVNISGVIRCGECKKERTRCWCIFHMAGRDNPIMADTTIMLWMWHEHFKCLGIKMVVGKPPKRLQSTSFS